MSSELKPLHKKELAKRVSNRMSPDTSVKILSLSERIRSTP